MNGDDAGFDEAWYLKNYPDVAQAVRSGMFGSGLQHYLGFGKAEGRRARGGVAFVPGLAPLDWPPINVEVAASNEQIRAMLDRVRHNFEFMGEREPHWSVITDERYLSDSIEGSEEEFFASGKLPVAELTSAAARSGVRLGRGMTCFELGCGVGRSTIWLADVFGQVIAADVSAPHLRLAAAAARRFGKANTNFVRIDRPKLIDDLPPFDLFFSIIVLQHNPPPVIYRYLAKILGKLNQGGIAYFQIPTYRLGYQFKIASYLASDTVLGMPEMHVLPQPLLHALFAETGCRAVEIREDGATGDNHHISQRFLLVKC
jgi:SAM-dependent methyltransferase